MPSKMIMDNMSIRVRSCGVIKQLYIDFIHIGTYILIHVQVHLPISLVEEKFPYYKVEWFKSSLFHYRLQYNCRTNPLTEYDVKKH